MDGKRGAEATGPIDAASVKATLEEAGIEVYRTSKGEIQIAERVRLHIMDSGVRVAVSEEGLVVVFTARSQRSDFPTRPTEDLFAIVRARVGAQAGERGYEEGEPSVHEVLDPMDETKILDVWHEIPFRRATAASELVDEVRWALQVEKYVAQE